MGARRARIRSLAKINLDLHVLNRRADGFHDIRTVFQTVSMADTLDIEYTPGRRTSIDLEGSDIPDNLVVRAAQALVEAIPIRGAIRFRLAKRIPMGAGLGGGSSNAAAVLLALPVLAGRNVDLAALAATASSLGSDVPFFLHGGTCLGLGRGTELYPLPGVRSYGALVTPAVHVSTPDAYRALNRPNEAGALTTPARGSDTGTSQRFSWALEQGVGWQALAANDFEDPVFRQHPELAAIKKKLARSGAFPAMMTGSGSAVFGLFDSRAAATEARMAFNHTPAFEITLVSRRQYRSMWRRQLKDHLLTDDTWPPRTRYE